MSGVPSRSVQPSWIWFWYRSAGCDSRPAAVTALRNKSMLSEGPCWRHTSKSWLRSSLFWLSKSACNKQCFNNVNTGMLSMMTAWQSWWQVVYARDMSKQAFSRIQHPHHTTTDSHYKAAQTKLCRQKRAPGRSERQPAEQQHATLV